MRRPVFVLLAVLLATNLTACGSDQKPPRTTAAKSFERSLRGERVFAAYGRKGPVSRRLTLPKGTRELGVYLDCVGSIGSLEVTFGTAGGAGIPCSTKSGSGHGVVFLGGDGSLLDRAQTMTVSVDATQRWSVAIDAGAKLTSN